MISPVCPFCNSVLPTLSAQPPGDKLPCPRCGEPIPVARWRIDDTCVRAGEPISGAGGPVDPTFLSSQESSRTVDIREKRSNVRKTALVVLGIMLTMAIIGLSYMLWTTKLRQSRHPQKRERIPYRRPLELSGLGFLPKDTQIALGLQIGALLDDPADKTGQRLLEEPRPFLLDWVAKQITRTTSLRLEDIDHVVAAVAFDAHFPQLILVVKTRMKYSLEKIAETIPATKRPYLHQHETLYEFSLKPFGEALLWCVEPQTLLYVIRLDPPNKEHLQGLSVKPRPVEDLLAAQTRQVLTERLSKQKNFLWAAGQLEQWGAARDRLPIVVRALADLGPLSEMKTFALGVEPGVDMTLTAYFQLADAKATAQFKAFLDDVKIAGATSHKVVAPPADTPGPDAHWVTWQVHGEVAALRDLLNFGKDGKK